MRFRLAPVGAGPMLASSILSNYAIALPTLIAEILICRWVLHIENWGNPWAMLLLITFGSAAFSSFGLIVASVTNTMQETQIINQLIWMAFLFLSGATIPLATFPGWIRRVSLFLPATYLAAGLENSAIGRISWGDVFTDTLGLAVTLFVTFEISRRLFRWEPEAKMAPRAKLWVVAAMVPIFLFGAYENIYGHMLDRATLNFRTLFDSAKSGVAPQPQPLQSRDAAQH